MQCTKAMLGEASWKDAAGYAHSEQRESTRDTVTGTCKCADIEEGRGRRV